jgi:hypothetical protein
MNIQKVLLIARKNNTSIRQINWPSNVYAYHGMDNLLYISNSDGKHSILTMNIALLLSDDWEICNYHQYHGSLDQKE